VLPRLSENVIESTLKRNGRVVDRWTRELFPGRNTMHITQHVLRPNGDSFQSISLYRRLKQLALSPTPMSHPCLSMRQYPFP
jgi:hypothetical protein